MKKIPIALLIISFILLFLFREINDLAIMLLSGIAGLAGTYLLYRYREADLETAILSGLMFLGGVLVPALLPALRDYSLIFYAAVVVLMVLKPPDMTATKVPVQNH